MNTTNDSASEAQSEPTHDEDLAKLKAVRPRPLFDQAPTLLFVLQFLGTAAAFHEALVLFHLQS